MRTATEAVIELFNRTDGKRRALLVMKWTEANEIRAKLFEPHIASNHVDDVDVVQQSLQKRMRNHREKALNMQNLSL